ncbi:sulfite exporter TauE/SafE family protein [Profundibacterium mesophilum]|uniref:Probable membrane transporter protein n=1 Tax=Profundibacterium mesophilum KAUST100406-0324 TaxID=1037889 RepID=A0A921NRJ2_9RHOB|nr:sulfite exporter TauE/SafE family protein [Profundibacterium mesophilum]KAF0677347.1 putative integral membrane protein [Profundibacterium mesophilum KAUST100406-0324]
MILDFSLFLLAIPAVLFAGISKGGFASGAAFAATPFLALAVTPGQAIGLMLPLLMLMDVAALRPYWRRWDSHAATALILGALPGVALGAALYGVADPELFKLLIGVVALAFVAFQLSRALGLLRLERRRPGGPAGYLWGCVAGFTSFISHAGGPPAAVYLLPLGLSKQTFQATTVITFWAINLAKFAPYAYLGIFSRETFLAALLLSPVALMGIWIGVRLHRRVPERLFFGLTYLFLTVTGGKLVIDGLS